MSVDPLTSWLEANQRYMTAALRVVQRALEACAVRQRGTALASSGTERGEEADAATMLAEVAAATLAEAAAAMPAPPALETLCQAFGLSSFERDVLLLCAGIELDAAFAASCAAARGDARSGSPTFGLALAALPGAHWSALTPASPLRRWRLIELGEGEALTTSPLRIDERVLHYLTGISYLDERLVGVVTAVPRPEHVPHTHDRTARQLRGLLSRSGPEISRPLVMLVGADGPGRRAIAATACASLGFQLYTMRSAEMPLTVGERESLARVWEREAILGHSALLVEIGEADSLERMHALTAWVERVQTPLLVSAREPVHLSGRSAVRLDVNRPSAQEQQQLWQTVLGPLSQRLNGQLEAVATHFNLGIEGIRAAGSQVRDLAPGQSDDALEPLLWDACRAQTRSRLEDLAQRLEPSASWEDLVLPDLQHQLLRDIVAQVRQRVQVYERWGFGAKGQRGLGISALFSGPSGTGKTMAAEVLAGTLRLDLYRIDLSSVVSKYIGETEKNLRRIFDAADEGGVLLLFDEADALFGKRSEVKDSHDRYANIEVSYLLQRMEAYRGLAILTTNMKDALDRAFLRRIRFVVQFPFPDAAQRAEIWRRVFPPATPASGLDVQKLARLNITGGNIRSIALNAAFLAADRSEPVQMRHLLRAARAEYAKLEKPLTEAEVGGWA